MMRRRILFKVEQNRVLVPVGEPCSFGCRYCYTRGGEVGLTPVEPEEILARLQAFALETPFETIQFGYDGDPFASPERGLAMLNQLADMGKHVNFSTKALLEGPVMAALKALRQRMEALGTTLSALVSLSCWEAAPLLEPHTPSPTERIRTVTNLAQNGIPVFIALRPVFPHIPDQEYARIVIEGVHAGSEGFIVGPLYADAHGQFVRFVPPAALEAVPRRTHPVPWSAHAPRWTRYEDPDRLQRLMQIIEQQQGRAFVSSADAVRLAHQREAVR